MIFFEPKRLYRGPFDGDPEHVPPWRDQPEAEVPDGYYRTPLGQAAVVRSGEEVTVVTWGTMVHVAAAAIDAGGRRCRADRPADAGAARSGDDRRIGRKDGPLHRRARSAADVRLRCRSRRAGAATLLLEPGSAGGARHGLGHARSACAGVAIHAEPRADRMRCARTAA